MNILTDFILSPGFTVFTTVAGLFGDAAALFIAAYALYLSAFSQNIDHKLRYKGDKNNEENKKEVAKFYQSFLELGRIKKINIELIEGSDNRNLPPGGQLIETFIHHCLIASLFVGLPSTWKIKEYRTSEQGGESSVYLSACGEHNEDIYCKSWNHPARTGERRIVRKQRPALPG